MTFFHLLNCYVFSLVCLWGNLAVNHSSCFGSQVPCTAPCLSYLLQLYVWKLLSHIWLFVTLRTIQWVSEIAQSCPTLCNPMDCSPPGSSIHGILQARILRWVAISFSRGSSLPRDRTQISRIAGRPFNPWVTREAPDNFWINSSHLHNLHEVYIVIF